ncbi:MAG: hypothetical protein DRO23_00215 [Thermoprotei archaeon]|nr:MAG: hypothetical protein DRO23_00215 [Thermoprotei archaeon]
MKNGYDYFMLVISSMLPALYIAETLVENVLYSLLCIIYFAASSYTVLSGNTKLYVLLLLIGFIFSMYNIMYFPLVLSLWLLSQIFSRKPYLVLLGSGFAYAILLKAKAMGLESSLAPCSFIILNLNLNYLELSLVLLGLISVIAVAFTADIGHFEVGGLAQNLALIVIVEAVLIAISWVNVLTSVVTIYGISIVLLIRTIEKYKT